VGCTIYGLHFSSSREILRVEVEVDDNDDKPEVSVNDEPLERSLSKVSERIFSAHTDLRHVQESSLRLGSVQLVLDNDFEMCRSIEYSQIWETADSDILAISSDANQSNIIPDDKFVLIVNFRTTSIEKLKDFESASIMDIFPVDDEKNNELHFLFLVRKVQFRINILKIYHILDQLPISLWNNHDDAYFEYNSILKRCASISSNRILPQNLRSGHFTSVLVTVQDVDVTFELAQHIQDISGSESLILMMKSLSYRLYPTSMGTYNTDSISSKSKSLWDSVDSVLPIIAGNIRKAGLTPALIDLTNFQITIERTRGDSEKLMRFLFSSPLSMKIMTPRFDSFSNELIEIHQNPINIYFSPVHFQLHLSDIEVFAYYLDQYSIRKNPIINVRLKSLAPYSSTDIHINFDSIELSIMPETACGEESSITAVKDAVKSSLNSFAMHLKAPKSKPPDLLQLLERKISLKLQYLGIPAEVANSIISSFRKSLSPLRLVTDSIKEVMDRIEKFTRRGRDLPLVFVRMFGISMTYYTLTYDHRLVLTFEEAQLFDHLGNAVFHCMRPLGDTLPNEFLFTPATERKSSIFTQPRRIEVESEVQSSLSSFSATVVIQDVDHPWGQGGFAVNVLHDFYLTNNKDMLPSREANTMFKLENLLSVLSVDEMSETVDFFVQLIMLLKRYRIFSSAHAIEIRSMRKCLDLSIQSVAKSVDIFFQSSEYLTSCASMQGAKLILSDVLKPTIKIPRSMCSVDNIFLLDLSPSLPTHYEVLSKENYCTKRMLRLTSTLSDSTDDSMTILSLSISGCKCNLDFVFLISLSSLLSKFHDDVIKKLFETIDVGEGSIISYFSALNADYEALSFMIPEDPSSEKYIVVNVRSGDASLHRSVKHWSPPEKKTAKYGQEDHYFNLATDNWELDGLEEAKKAENVKITLESEGCKFPRLVISSHGISIEAFTPERKQISESDTGFSKIILIEFISERSIEKNKIRILFADNMHGRNDILMRLSFLQYNLLMKTLTRQYNLICKHSFWDTYSDCGNAPVYGSVDYSKYLIEQPTTFELLWASKKLQVKFYIENSECYRFSLRPETQNFLLKISTIQLFNTVLHIKYGGDSFRLALGCAGVEIEDSRIPRKTLHPSILSASYLSHRTRCTSFADFHYGITTTPSFQTLDDNLELPLQLTYFKTRSTDCATCNIGICSSTLHIKDIEIFSLLSSFFSLYFLNLSEVFKDNDDTGSPRARRQSFLSTSSINSAIDFRIFCYKPHLTIPKDPLSDSSEMLMIETNNGIFSRFKIDSKGSYRIETQLNDLAVVIFKSYEPPEISRGRRGISGSGFGVRTALEFLCCSFSYHYDATSNNVNMIANLSPASMQSGYRLMNETALDEVQTTQGESCKRYVNLDDEIFVSAFKVNIDLPTCVWPTKTPTTRSMQSSCDIVISCEDGFFIMDCLYGIFGKFSLFEIFSGLFKNDVGEYNSLITTKTAYYVGLRLECVRLIVVDDTLGLHQPLLQSFFDHVDFIFSSSSTSSNNR